MGGSATLASVTLGSASPRRSMLLRRLGLVFETASVDIDEHHFARPGEPDASVRAIAAAKFATLAPMVTSDLLITADTLVALGDRVMGKPGSDDDLRAMLVAMSGQTISISTGLCVGPPRLDPNISSVETLVALNSLSEKQIDDYIETGIGMDKAGGLALQAQAGPFIDDVSGCWSNVVGLPVCAVADMLKIRPQDGNQQDRCSIELCGTHR